MEVPKSETAIPEELPSKAQEVIKLAKEDLAGRLGISVEQITLSDLQEVDWPDASLGCPEAGKMYAQVITPGFIILLEANGQAYEYHSDTHRHVVLCVEGRSPVEPVPLMPIAPHGKPPKGTPYP